MQGEVALAAIKGEKTVGELVWELDVHTNQIMAWRSQILERAVRIFGGEATLEVVPLAIDVRTRHATFVELTPKRDFLSVALGKVGSSPSAKR